MRKTIFVGVVISIFGWSSAGWTWDPNEVEELTPKVAEAVAAMKAKDPGIATFFEKATGYVVFPTVGKGGIGGARGKGLLMVGGQTVAVVTLTQVTFGFQAGAQAYSEFIFFEDDLALANFRRGNYEPSGREFESLRARHFSKLDQAVSALGASCFSL